MAKPSDYLISRLSRLVADIARQRSLRPIGDRAPAFNHLRILLAGAVHRAQCVTGSLWLRKGTDFSLTCELAHLDEHITLAGYHLAPGEGVAGFVAMSGEPMAVNNIEDESRHARRADRILHHRTLQMLSVPLISRGERIGAMNLVNRIPEAREDFTDFELLAAQLEAGAIADFILDSGLLHSKKTVARSASRSDGRQVPATPPILSMDRIQSVFVSEAMRGIAAAVRESEGQNIMITGETGSGKDFLARWTHEAVMGDKAPFISVNCAAVHESLWDSELFGHIKGSFTGAVDSRVGKIELADKGTLFLNEIGEIPPHIQAKLLSFLDDGEIWPVGASTPRRVKPRIIAATNRDLEKGKREGHFRTDVYYRLAQLHLHIPPLRERTPDILALAVTQAGYCAAQSGKRTPLFTQELRAYLTEREWPGNVRELLSAVENAVRRCLRAGDEELSPEHFATAVGGAPPAAIAAPPAKPTGSSDHAAMAQTLVEFLLTEYSQKMNSGGNGSALNGATGTGAHAPRAAMGDIFEQTEKLVEILDKTRCRASGRWNLAAAHRVLHDAGVITVSRKTFERRIKNKFPNLNGERAEADC